MKFTKMHGCGNDYIYVNGFEEKVEAEQKPELARRLSHRQHGIGGDGLIFINPSRLADFEMEMYNADGTRAQMCGNGIRCVGKYVYDKGMTDGLHITVESGGQVKQLELMPQEYAEAWGGEETERAGQTGVGSRHAGQCGEEAEHAEQTEAGAASRHAGQCGEEAEYTGRYGKEREVMYVRVNMGSPILTPYLIPVVAEGAQAVNVPIVVDGIEFRMTCVSMGNPHAVIFAKGVRKMELDRIGSSFEHHVRFPERVNTEFVEILDREHCFLRVWERGTGETLACGTGACAAVVAAMLNDLTQSRVTVTMLGGELLIEWDREKNIVYMTGPAVTVFEGSVNGKEDFLRSEKKGFTHSLRTQLFGR